MTEITALAEQAKEITINDNESFIYWGDWLKKASAAKVEIERLIKTVKGKISDYRYAQESDRQRMEKKILFQCVGMGLPAVVTKTVPELQGVSYRKSTKWRVKNAKTVPREYLTTDDKKIDAAVKALGMALKIKGIEVFEEEVVVVRSAE